MKTRTFLFIALLLTCIGNVNSQEVAPRGNLLREGTISVICSPDLYSLATKWTDEYSRLNPELNIRVMKVPDAELAGMIESGSGIGIVSADSDPALHVSTNWNMVVGRDVIVPVLNEKNPLLNEIKQKGVSSAALARIMNSPEKHSWGVLLETGQDLPVQCYMVNDVSVKSGVADFLKVKQDDINVIMVENGTELTAAIQKDPNAIGFCRLAGILDANNQSLAENIQLLPLDKNGNGRLDYMENIYDNLQTFTRGVWIGKYPKALSGNIYAVAPVKPANENETAFLTWVLTEGQLLLHQQGFCNLVNSESQMQLDNLINTPKTAVAVSNNWLDNIMWAILVIVVFGLVIFIMDKIAGSLKHKLSPVQGASSLSQQLFNSDSLKVPKGLYYDKTHTWAFMEKDGTVKIGIDDFLQHITGPLSRIGMKPAGVKIKKGDPFLTIIQNGKQLIINSPVTGTITEYNKTLITNSSVLNTSPYFDGWVYLVEPSNWLMEIQFLSMAEKYKTWLTGEFQRLKDFFAMAANDHTPEYAHVVMQDGGMLKAGILADLGPKVWEDFQTKFIDNTK